MSALHDGRYPASPSYPNQSATSPWPRCILCGARRPPEALEQGAYCADTQWCVNEQLRQQSARTDVAIAIDSMDRHAEFLDTYLPGAPLGASL